MNGDQIGNAARAWLYFLLPVLSAVSAVYGETAVYGYWPDAPRVVAAVLAGVVAGLIAVKGFYDGSNAEYRRRREEDGGGE